MTSALDAEKSLASRGDQDVAQAIQRTGAEERRMRDISKVDWGMMGLRGYQVLGNLRPTKGLELSLLPEFHSRISQQDDQFLRLRNESTCVRSWLTLTQHDTCFAKSGRVISTNAVERA